ATKLRPRLNLSLVAELRRPRAQHLAHRVPRDVQFPDDLLDRPSPRKKLAPDPRNRIHALHPPPPIPNQRMDSLRSHQGGSKLDADPPAQGVKFARRMTLFENEGRVWTSGSDVRLWRFRDIVCLALNVGGVHNGGLHGYFCSRLK